VGAERPVFRRRGHARHQRAEEAVSHRHARRNAHRRRPRRRRGARRGDDARRMPAEPHGHRALHLAARPHPHARRPHRPSDPPRDLPGVVPGRVRPRGRRRAAAGEDATGMGCRGDLGHELRRPMRRLEDPKRIRARAPATPGNLRRPHGLSRAIGASTPPVSSFWLRPAFSSGTTSSGSTSSVTSSSGCASGSRTSTTSSTG
jgi:hypothetical protein